jgi:hypothetical protein
MGKKKRPRKNLLNIMNVKIEPGEVRRLIESIDSKEYVAYGQILEILSEKKIETIYCIGLGDPCRNLACREQTQLILSVSKELGVENLPFFDPDTCESCKETLKEMGFNILTENRNGAYEIEEKTCFYMPHCPLNLYHSLIISNLERERLKNAMVIGNSFEERAEAAKYESPKVNSIIEESFSRGFIIEKKLDFGRDLFFNQTAVMMVDPDKLPEDADDFWKPRGELKM